MSFLGLSPDDYVEENTAWVWPCNVQAVNLFIEIGSQWRVGQAGPYALDYNVLYTKLDRMAVSADTALQLENDIRILEDAALEQMLNDRE